MDDNSAARFGSSDDLQIYHNGVNSVIYENGTGNLSIMSSGGSIVLEKSTGEPMGTFTVDGAVSLYHDNALKFATTSDGVNISDESGAVHLRLYTGTSTLRGYLYADDSNRIHLLDAQGHKVVGGEMDGHSGMYYDNSLKFYTQSYGGVIDGDLKPAANNTHDLGDNSYRFDKVWAKNTVKAWINWNGTLSSSFIRSSFNVASITDNDSARHTVNIDQDFADANYCTVSHAGNSGGGGRTLCQNSAPGVGHYSFQMLNLQNNYEEFYECCAAFLGN